MLDLTAPLIFLSIFVFACFSLFLVYKYGIKNKSYEEALAEQRRQTSILLGVKPKPKEKKSKKAAKKVNKEKEKLVTPPENETPDDSESVDSKDLPDQEPVKSQPQSQGKSSGPKGKIHKQSKIHVEFKEDAEEVPVEIPAEKEVKEVFNKKRVKKVRPILQKKSSEQEVILPIMEAPLANHFEELHPKDEFELWRGNSREDVRKPDSPKADKKPEKTTKKNKQHKVVSEASQQLEKNGPVVEPVPVEKEKAKEEKIVENSVVPLVHEPVINTGKEKKKKKSEFNSRQQMTAERDHLIHAVQNAELSRTEVQLLIDMLLNKQLEAPAVIDDWSEGKSDPVQKLKKQLADKEKQLADEQDALVGVQAKLKEVRSEQLAEKAQFQQKLRAAEESRLEYITANKQLQQKLHELEELYNKHMASMQMLMEENAAYKNNMAQLENTLLKFQETDAHIKTDNSRLTGELQLLTEERQTFAFQIQDLQEKLRSTNEYIKNLESNHGFVISTHQEESRKLAEQLKKTTETYLKEEQKLKDTISQLKMENLKLQEEKSVQINGSEEENKEHEVKILNLTNELSSVKSELGSVCQTLLDAERQYRANLSLSQENYDQLKEELEEQKNKNNELRKKNWKVMEALNAAESRNKPVSNAKPDIDIDKLASEIKRKEQTAQKEFLLRLFPEIESLKSVTDNDWQSETERAIEQYVRQLHDKLQESPANNADVTKLQNEVLHYKKIIDETEGILKRLESHIEQEELKWRHQLAQKDTEIQELKTQIVSQLQIKVAGLEDQLAREIEEKRFLEQQRWAETKHGSKTVQPDAAATIAKLSENETS